MRSLTLLLLVLAALAGANGSATAATGKAKYTFTKIADNGGAPFSAFFAGASINASGTVAFQGTLAAGGVGIFTGKGGATTSIALSTGPDFSGFNPNPSINAAGTVAFVAAGKPVGLLLPSPGIYTGDGGPLTTVVADVDTVGGLGNAPPQINDAGTVVFDAFASSGIYTWSGGQLTLVATDIFSHPQSGSPYRGVGNPAINASGTVVFQAGLIIAANGDNTSGIYSGAAATIHECVRHPMAIGTGICPASGGGSLAINADGTVAFLGQFPQGTWGVVTATGGGVTTVASGAVAIFSFPDHVSINGSGTVVFHANFGAGDAIFAGPDSAAANGVDKVVAIDDPLFGSTVTKLYVGSGALNDLGQVAFDYELASGGKGIAVATSTSAAALKCRAAIVAAGSGLLQSEGKALSACAGKVVSGKLPHGTTCRTEAKTAAGIAKAESKVLTTVAKTCGGKDKTCGAGGDDVPLVDTGWQIGTCPNIGGGACTNAITDCGGIATCLTCIDEAAIDQATSLYYDALVQTDPKDKAQKALNTCQSTIGRATTTFLSAKSKALAKCWQTVNAGKATGDCPAADGKAVGAIAKAESKKVAAICKACGGADKTCGGADDLTPAAIGFPSTCPAVDPGGVQSCFGTIVSLPDLVTCVDCVTESKVDCATLAAVPGLATYPSQCTVSSVPSRRSYKKNIEYLGTADLQRLHDELLKFHLASYQYNTPGASPATHLGFIIDDVTPSPSVAANGDTVDLYGYTSMAVAAVQTQAHEIDTLKREVESLRAQIATSARGHCGVRAAASRRSNAR